MSLAQKFNHALKARFSHRQTEILAAQIVGFLVPLLHRTWRITLENEARMEALVRDEGGVIFVTWHGRSLVPIACTRNRGYYALVSHSRDGGMLCAIFEKLGWKTVRGSTGRRAVQALRQGCEVLSRPGTVLAFTPDGPRGPSHVAKPGMIYYAQKSGKPIIPVGVSARPRRLLKSWDRYLIPLPFARCFWIYGEPIFATPEDDVEELACRVGAAITALEVEADRRLGYAPLPHCQKQPV